MGYETPISVKELVEGIRDRKYFLPSIQREFVWDSDRIAKLFDSLMKGFPIGSFLFWEVPKDKIEDFSFYEFIRDFHALDNKHNKVAPLTMTSAPFVAILDGQQRMTSLYIGLMGSYAEKLKHKKKENKNAYPVKKLYLNLMYNPEATDELGLTYDFKFLEPAEVQKINASGNEHWFKVGEILNSEYEDANGILDYVSKNNLTSFPLARKILSTLQKKIWDVPSISFYLEKSDKLDKVVNIFIRVNGGGLVLSYSDLLLSFATAQLHGVQDFRGDIYNFVDNINDICPSKGGSDNFAFDKDFILKAILVLCDLNVKFRADNFKRDNMLKIHDRWYDVTKAIEQAVSLISSYGFNKTNMVSTNAVIPIAYYILKKGVNPKNYTKNERNIIRWWFIVASIGGLFRSSTDNILTSLRGIIKDDNTSFPAPKMLLNKNDLSLDSLINDILDTEYKDKSITMAMSILYPKVNWANNYHIDHIFPQSKFKKKFFAEKNTTDIDFYMDNLNSFANLQLLPASQNQSKNDEFFDEWLKKMSLADREAYMKEHYIPTDIDLSFGNFKEFIQKREELIRQRLIENLKSWNIFA